MLTNLHDLAADVAELDGLYAAAQGRVARLKAALSRAKETESYYYRLRSQLGDMLELRSMLSSDESSASAAAIETQQTIF